jgi:cytochrome c oxidase assembly protein subunit 15
VRLRGCLMCAAERGDEATRTERGAFALVAATAALLVVGASVRVNGAGLACPDWPLCFGEVVPPLDVKVGFEWGHRVLAGGISLGFLGLGAALWRTAAPRSIRALWGLAAVVLGVQVVLGGLTVWHLLAEWTVASHLLTGNTFCALLLLLALSLRAHHTRAVPSAVPSWLRVPGVALLVLAPLQLFLGGWVAGANAGLVCGAVPGCYTPDGAWFPTFSGVVGLQVTHRLVGLLLWATAVGFAVVARGSVRSPATAVAVAATAQVGLGVLNVLWRLPVEITLLHTAGAAAVYLSTAWAQWTLWRSPVLGAVVRPSGVVSTA